jgi:hypothetical protein
MDDKYWSAIGRLYEGRLEDTRDYYDYARLLLSDVGKLYGVNVSAVEKGESKLGKIFKKIFG